VKDKLFHKIHEGTERNVKAGIFGGVLAGSGPKLECMCV